MTTKDIAKAQIYFIGKNGEILIGETTDEMILQVIASNVQFIQADESRFATAAIKDIIKQPQGKNKTP